MTYYLIRHDCTDTYELREVIFEGTKKECEKELQNQDNVPQVSYRIRKLK